MEKLRSASVPHIRFEFPKKPFQHFGIHTRVLQCGWRHSDKFALCFSLMVMLSILLPYTISLANGNVRPLLPVLRDSNSQSSEDGIISIALFVTALLGGVVVSVRYVHVSSQNENGDWRVRLLNRVGLTCGIVALIGLLAVASFPFGGHLERKSREPSLLVPHLLAAFLSFFFGALYLLLQTAVSLFFLEGNAKTALLRFLLFILCTGCFATSTMSTFNSEDVSSLDSRTASTEVTTTKIVSGQLLWSSACEWMMIFFFALYFLTFVGESRRMSVAITFRQLLAGRRLSLASISSA